MNLDDALNEIDQWTLETALAMLQQRGQQLQTMVAKYRELEQKNQQLRTALEAADQWMTPVLIGFGLRPDSHVVVRKIRAALALEGDTHQ